MNFVGIDYSLTSPAVTILTDNTLLYFAFPRENSLKENFQISLEKAGVKCTNVANPKITKGKTSQEKERINSIDAALLATTICLTIKPFIEKDTIICIEGMSFNAPGNTKIQYAGYHYILRYIIQTMFDFEYENMYVLAPMSVKKVAGKGNFKKDDMINAFMNYDFGVINNFKDKLISDPLSFQSPKAHHWSKPVDDIVDSFWTMIAGKQIAETKSIECI
jgi:hypothetical protein